MTSAAHPLTILAKNGLHVSPVHRLGRIWAAFFEPSAPKMALVDAFGDLWGALGMAGWGPWAPRVAAGRKVEKNSQESLFWDPKWLPFWVHF